jgi:hypothetical protein
MLGDLNVGVGHEINSLFRKKDSGTPYSLVMKVQTAVLF